MSVTAVSLSGPFTACDVLAVSESRLGYINGASMARVDGTNAGALWKIDRRPTKTRR